jgi:hypothetical protein
MATRGYDTSQLFLRAVFEEKEEKEKEGWEKDDSYTQLSKSDTCERGALE